MKNKKYILFCLFLLYLAPAKASDITKDENKYVTISGTVKTSRTSGPCLTPMCPSPEARRPL